MKRFVIPIAMFALVGLWVGMQSVTPTDGFGQMKVQEFGRLPVVYQGRIKPYDTLARNSLLIISEKQSFYTREADGSMTAHPAIEWLLDVMASAPAATQHKVFRIENQQVLDLLGLTARAEPSAWKFRYALDEFKDKIKSIDEQANRARRIDASSRDAFDTNIIKLADRLQLYIALQEASHFPMVRTPEEQMMVEAQFTQLEQLPLPRSIPPSTAGEDWQPFMSAALKMFRPSSPEAVARGRNPAIRPFAMMMVGRMSGEVQGFNEALRDFRAVVDKNPPVKASLMSFEAFFNHVSPFYIAMEFYVGVFLLAIVAWLGWSGPLNRAAFWLMVATVAVHTLALAGRIYISGRPPVTNLYSSAVFIGWGAVLFAIALEHFYRLGIGNILGATVGFLTLLIAHHLSFEGDTLQMMQAVLDTNFWLATHVTCVTMGYASTFVAGFLGVTFVLRGVFTRRLDPPTVKLLGRMIYGIICFAMFFSFVGTVLGGLWADDSWGRFWGWDPKENGALIIVLWNALILHARWGGMVAQRGVAVLAVGGNVVTAWSWFGVNMLGVGLHSYGFMTSAVFWLAAFVVANLAVIALGAGLPWDLWRSNRRAADRSPIPAGALPNTGG
jgi:ABC-type transport system involved in cytochrome c biogenesis permease subunit